MNEASRSRSPVLPLTGDLDVYRTFKIQVSRGHIARSGNPGLSLRLYTDISLAGMIGQSRESLANHLWSRYEEKTHRAQDTHRSIPAGLRDAALGGD